MVKRSEHLGLTPEARQALRVRSERRRENFQGYVAPELGIACAVDLTHPSSPKGCEDLVVSETSTSTEAHRVLILTHQMAKRNGCVRCLSAEPAVHPPQRRCHRRDLTFQVSRFESRTLGSTKPLFG